MSTDPERYIVNTLKPVIDPASIESTKRALSEAISASIDVFAKRSKDPTSLAPKPRLYTGDAGEAVALLRLYTQARWLDVPEETIRSLPGLIDTILEPCFRNERQHLPPPTSSDPRDPGKPDGVAFGYCGVMISPVGPALLEVVRQVVMGGTPRTGDYNLRWEFSLTVLEDGYRACFEGTGDGISTPNRAAGDMAELLYGTAGYLYALLGLRAMLSSGRVGAPDLRLTSLTSDSAIQKLVDNIIESGVQGATLLQNIVGSNVPTPPLMWRSFYQRYYLGAIHGIAGVLLMLVQCPRHMIDRYLESHILPTVDWLLSQQVRGNVPSSFSTRGDLASWYCHFCHGAPGLAMLLCTLRKMIPDAMSDSSTAARFRRQTLNESLEFIWKEGLVKKGLGLCHGLSGNAVPFLLDGMFDVQNGAHDSISLGRALAMLKLSTGLPPLNMPQAEDGVPIDIAEFGTPDHPYSLFEGLAGAVCVWADALALLNGLSSGEDVDGNVIGFPLVGGLGIRLPL